jgi:hypoxanthine phosphoribosyltransferase
MNKLVIDFQGYRNLISKICHDISNSNWKPDYVVGLTRGGLLPAVMISHYLDVPCETLKICLRDHSVAESNCWMAQDAIGYVPLEDRKQHGGFHHIEMLKKNILIVDDINDTGATLNWLITDWAKSVAGTDATWDNVWNHNVRFAVVVDNLSSDCAVKMDYCGMEVNKDENDVWVDFPYEEWWAK